MFDRGPQVLARHAWAVALMESRTNATSMRSETSLDGARVRVYPLATYANDCRVETAACTRSSANDCSASGKDSTDSKHAYSERVTRFLLTMSDLARSLNLSTSTVSRALTRPEMVAPETLERVLQL